MIHEVSKHVQYLILFKSPLQARAFIGCVTVHVNLSDCGTTAKMQVSWYCMVNKIILPLLKLVEIGEPFELLSFLKFAPFPDK